MVLYVKSSVSEAWASVNPIMLDQSCRKLLWDLEDDFQGFLNEEIMKSKILDMVCAMKSFQNMNKDNV
jgi:hypothetical protein